MCRYPVSVPRIGLDDLSLAETSFDIGVAGRSLTGAEGALLSVVRFRLGQKLYDLGLVKFHIRSDEMAAFRDRFKSIVSSTEVIRERLEKLASFLARGYEKTVEERTHKNAALLLCGVKEETWMDLQEIDRQVPNVTITVDGRITTNIDTQLLLSESEIDHVYNEGKSRFLAMLEEENTKLLSGSPLEAAYLWVMSSRSACKNILHFGTVRCGIRCNRLEGGRLFDSSFREDCTEVVSQLSPETIYYVLEGEVIWCRTHFVIFNFLRRKSSLWSLISLDVMTEISLPP